MSNTDDIRQFVQKCEEIALKRVKSLRKSYISPIQVKYYGEPMYYGENEEYIENNKLYIVTNIYFDGKIYYYSFIGYEYLYPINFFIKTEININ